MRTVSSSVLASIAVSSLIAAGAAFGQDAGQPHGGMNPPSNVGDMGAMTPMDNPTTGELQAHDRSFVMAAARGGMEEVDLGKLAAERAANPDVKSFGQRMIDDHSKANERLRQVASAKGLILPSGPDRKARSDYDRLAKLSGADFDRAYVKMMVKDHVDDVADFNRAAQNADDSDIRQFASSTLPTIKDHLRMAKDLQDKVDQPSHSR
jgi:putative membrane protein